MQSKRVNHLFNSLALLDIALVFLSCISPAWSGELKKAYFTATKHGAWADYLLTSSDGAKSSFSYEREADDAGRAVIQMQCKILAGPGKDSKTKLTYILPKSFNLDRDGLNYGKVTEKMLMVSNGNEMPIDEKTLETIRRSSKDFGGAVTFEGVENIGSRSCDRYAYSLKSGGPSLTLETGKLWLDPSLPFAVVRQVAKVVKVDGTTLTEFDMKLQDTGLNQLIAERVFKSVPEKSKKAAVPSKVSLREGFKAGRIGMDIEVVPGSAGHNLRFTLVNKTDAALTVTVSAGELEFAVDSPVDTLRITLHKAATVVMPANDKAEPILVEQRGARGIAEGHCSLSVYEGTPLFSGSVTMDTLPK